MDSQTTKQRRGDFSRHGGIRGGGILLTDTEIRKSKPTDKAYRLADSKGLFLFITPTGGKLWRFKYRHEGKQKLMALGQYPDVPLVLARERHAAARALLATGVDPMQVRKTEKVARKATSENSFRTIAGLWLEHWRVGKSGQHVDSTRRRIEANVFPLLGARPITEIEAPELVTMVKSIEGRGVGDLAKRALETTGQIFQIRHCPRLYEAQSRCRDQAQRHSEANQKDQSGPRRCEGTTRLASVY